MTTEGQPASDASQTTSTPTEEENAGVLPSRTDDGTGRLSNPRDEDALQTIFALRATRLETVRGRAEKWIAGLAAVVAVLGTVTLVKGPEKYTDLPDGARDDILMLSLGAAVALVIGLVAAYSAAFGGLITKGAVDELIDNPPDLDGVAVKLSTASENEIWWARAYLRIALLSTITGTCLLAYAVVISWSEVDEQPEDSACAIVDDKLVEFGSKPDVSTGSLNMVECPKK